MMRIHELKKTHEQLSKLNLDVQQDWQKLQMQGSDLERVERKHAEMEFILREKDKTIRQDYAQIMSKLENGSEDSLQILKHQEMIQSISALLQKERKLDADTVKVQQRLDNYYALNKCENQAMGLSQTLDEDVKVIMEEPTYVVGAKDSRAARISVVLRRLPNLFSSRQ